jgi:hypothetical protein
MAVAINFVYQDGRPSIVNSNTLKITIFVVFWEIKIPECTNFNRPVLAEFFGQKANGLRGNSFSPRFKPYC